MALRAPRCSQSPSAYSQLAQQSGPARLAALSRKDVGFPAVLHCAGPGRCLGAALGTRASGRAGPREALTGDQMRDWGKGGRGVGELLAEGGSGSEA